MGGKRKSSFLARLALAWALCLLPFVAGAQSTVPLDGPTGPFFLDRFVGAWFDAEGKATLQDVQALPAGSFQPLPDRRDIPRGGNAGALWLKVVLSPADNRAPWFIISYIASNDYVFLYRQAPNGEWLERRAGDMVPVADWPLPGSRPTFRVDPSPTAETTVYVRVQDRIGSFTRLQIARLDAWTQVKDEHALMFGMYFGISVLIFVMCIAFWVTYRDPVFGSYGAYSLSMAFAQASFSGLAGPFLYPRWAAANDYAIYFWISMAVSLGVLFALHVGSAWVVAVRWARTALGACVLLWIVMAVFAVERSDTLGHVLNGIDGLLGLMALLSFFITWRSGDRYSGVLLAACFPLVLSAMPLVLYNFRLIDSSFWTQYSLMLGSAFECVVLFFIVNWRSRDRAVSATRTRALETHDSLTGLANLRLLQDRLHGMQVRSRRQNHECALVLVDLMNYRKLVSQIGPEHADVPLVLAARHLGTAAHDVDTAARIGETLFALAIEGPVTAKQLASNCASLVTRGLRPQRMLAPGDTLEFRMVTALIDGDEHPPEKIIRYLARALRELDPADGRRIHPISLDALGSMPASSAGPQATPQAPDVTV
ncbi:MAG: 7TM diverse intracellular signaling domain-containing protein [Burkholderiaceae bacterium]